MAKGKESQQQEAWIQREILNISNESINLSSFDWSLHVAAFSASLIQVWDLILLDASHPHFPSQHAGMFIWTHAINPELSRRQGWAWLWCRRPAPMIVCGLVHVRQPTKRPQTATGWLHLWPHALFEKLFQFKKCVYEHSLNKSRGRKKSVSEVVNERTRNQINFIIYHTDGV